MAVRAMGVLRPRWEAQRPIREGRVRTTDGTVAISATGELNARTLAEVLRALPAEGTYELCCHPGYNDGELAQVVTRLRGEREMERAALLKEVPRVGVELIGYGEL
jgi:hypothetical protein